MDHEGADNVPDSEEGAEGGVQHEGVGGSVEHEGAALSRHSSHSGHSTLIAEGCSGASSPGSIVYGASPPRSVSPTHDDAVEHGSSPQTR